MATAPKEADYQEDKAWFTRKATLVTLGITVQSIEEIGDVEGVELPTKGEDFEKGDVVATIRGSQGEVELTAPATGAVEEVNESLQTNPEVVSEDPLEEGWIVKLEIQDKTDLHEYGEE